MIREYKESDLNYLGEKFGWAVTEIQYHQDVIPGSAHSAEDENGNCHGVVYLMKHFTYDSTVEELNKIVVNVYSDEDDYYIELLDYAKHWCDEQAKLHPDKKICLVTWVDDQEKEDLQTYLHNGFIEYEPCPCHKFDLKNAKDEVSIPEGMTIKKLEFTPDEVEKYILATADANNGTRDSANELWYLSGSGTCSVYMLMDEDRIVSSTSTWEITKKRSAIENIFTITAYRRRGMARTIIEYALSQAKKEGYEIGTLSVRGRNTKALRLYQSIGFEFYYNQIEMIYLPKIQ